MSAGLYSDPGQNASRRDPLNRVAARTVDVDDPTLSRRPRRHRLFADACGGPLLDEGPEFADRRANTDDLGNVWGERGGNEIPESRSYAGPR